MNDMLSERPKPRVGEAVNTPLSNKERLKKQVSIRIAFTKGLIYYEKDIRALKDKSTANKVDPENNSPLTSAEAEKLAEYNTCRNAIHRLDKAGVDGKQSIESSYNGKSFTSHEGIPVEGLIRTLEEQIEIREVSLSGLHEEKQDKVTQEIIELKQILKTLDDNSISFELARSREGLDNPDFWKARMEAEALFRSEDPLRKSENQNDEERMKEDYVNAEKALERRRELVMPSETAKPELTDQADQPADATTPHLTQPLEKGQVEPETQSPVQPSISSDVSPTESPLPLEDIDSSYFEQPQFVTERFLEDDLHKPVAKLSELEEARRNKKEGKLYAHQKVVDQMDTVEKLLTDPQIQQLLPIKDNETPDVYQKRLSVNLMARLRFHGKFEEKNDPLYLFLKDNLKDASGNPVPTGHWDEVLMGAEALNALSIKAGNDAKQKEYDQRMFDFHQRAERRRTAYGVDLGSDHQAATAALMEDHYLKVGEEGKVNKERAAEVDLVAFELVGQVLMDVGDVNNPALGKKPDGMPYTYAEVLHSLVSSVSQLAEEELQLKSQGQILSPEKQQQRDQLNQKLLHLREDFYLQTTDVLEKRHQQNPYTDQTSFGYLAFERLYGTGPGSLDLNSKTSTQAAQTLIDYYRGANPDYFPPNPTEVQQSRIDRIERRFNLLTSTSPDVIQLALKGADLMKRRIEALPPKPTLEKVPQRIYGKTFVDKGTYRGPVYEEEEVSVAPSKPAPTVTESVTGPGQEEELPATPIAGEGKEPSKKEGEGQLPEKVTTPPITEVPPLEETEALVEEAEAPQQISLKPELKEGSSLKDKIYRVGANSLQELLKELREYNLLTVKELRERFNQLVSKSELLDDEATEIVLIKDVLSLIPEEKEGKLEIKLREAMENDFKELLKILSGYEVQTTDQLREKLNDLKSIYEDLFDNEKDNYYWLQHLLEEIDTLEGTRREYQEEAVARLEESIIGQTLTPEQTEAVKAVEAAIEQSGEELAAEDFLKEMEEKNLALADRELLTKYNIKTKHQLYRRLHELASAEDVNYLLGNLEEFNNLDRIRLTLFGEEESTAEVAIEEFKAAEAATEELSELKSNKAREALIRARLAIDEFLSVFRLGEKKLVKQELQKKQSIRQKAIKAWEKIKGKFGREQQREIEHALVEVNWDEFMNLMRDRNSILAEQLSEEYKITNESELNQRLQELRSRKGKLRRFFITEIIHDNYNESLELDDLGEVEETLRFYRITQNDQLTGTAERNLAELYFAVRYKSDFDRLRKFYPI